MMAEMKARLLADFKKQKNKAMRDKDQQWKMKVSFRL
jgi:hypothetical protein